ncbi:MAG: hypothetical protein U5K75_12005 [Ahrensia sp.]|nr:hypothetical protein [Ahrensia sp.]
MPQGVSLSANVALDLSGLKRELQTYQGQKIRIRTVDDVCTRLIKSKKVGGVTIWSAQYFKGHLETDPRCFVAQQGDVYAHGDTAKQAMRDLEFKILQANSDASEVVARVIERNAVTFNDYRLITGACESGLIEGLEAVGRAGAEEMTLQDALTLSRGRFGGNVFAEAVRSQQ